MVDHHHHIYYMESIFHLNEGERAAFLRQLSHSFGFTFICLWSYLPHPSNCLLFMDGIYHDENKQLPRSSSSAISRGQTLFNEYQKSVFVVDNRGAPGFAFKNSLPYIDFKDIELQTIASTTTQLQFYQEARIKTAIFMGCKTGEIELGMPIETQADFENKLRNCFPKDVSQQSIRMQLPMSTDQNPQSSSSSSLVSLSTDSHDTGAMPNFLYNSNSNNNNSTNSYPLESSVQPSSLRVRPHQPISCIQNINQYYPSLLQTEDDALTRAMLALISASPSPSSSTNSSQKPQQNSSAFRSYRSVLAPTSQMTSRVVAHKQNMLKRAIAFVRSTVNINNQEQMLSVNRSTNSNQLHHMISERKRREKLNESFQALRSLLPPDSKKDKASVLFNTKEYMISLKAEVEELTRKNHLLEALLENDQSTDNQESTMLDGFSNDEQTLDVQITNIIAETTSAARILDLRVAVRWEYCSLLDLAIRVLEFLKQLENVSLISVEADTRPVVEAKSVNRLVFRLRVEVDELVDSIFQEAVRRLVADVAKKCKLGSGDT